MKVRETGQQVHFIFVIQQDKIVTYGGIFAVTFGENMSKQKKKRPAEHSRGQKKS